MRSRRLTIGVLLALCALLVATFAAGAAAVSIVRVGTLVLRADGGFSPHLLPRRSYAPIRFQGWAELDTTDGSPPPPATRIRLDFDRDGRLTTTGLASCPPSRIEGTAPEQARRACGGAIVGTGHVGAAISLPGRSRVDVRSPLTLFNGPRQGSVATVVAHAQTTFPETETYVVTIPVERRRGVFGYRATFDLPEIAGGYGALTRIDAKVGRRYRSGGAERSYISARCSDSILQTLGLVSFADGTVISGSIYKSCRAID